ncbi:MAG: preprotein translocase subunit SecG [Pseudomonadales bacterium]|nr:preprotein translocase subunit SecG [Pseudomonadales bacterium]
MMSLENILLILLVSDAITLIVLVLIQQGKGADVGAAFGSGSSNTVFGGAGSASFLAKLTTWLAIGFFALSFGLAFTAKEKAAGLLDLGMPALSTPLADEPGGDSGAEGLDAETASKILEDAEPMTDMEEALSAPGANNDTLNEVPDL